MQTASFPPLTALMGKKNSKDYLGLIPGWLRCPGRVLARPHVAERDLTLPEKVS